MKRKASKAVSDNEDSGRRRALGTSATSTEDSVIGGDIATDTNELEDLERVVTSSRRTPDEEALAAYLLQELHERRDVGLHELKRIANLYRTFLYPLSENKEFVAFQVLENAIETGRLEIVRHVVDSGVPVGEDENRSSSPMLIACRNGHLEIAKFLVERGASVFAAESLRMRWYSWSTLLAVCESTCDLKFVKWLVKNHANINGSALQCATPIAAAVKKGALSVVRYLVEAGARTDADPLSGANSTIYEAVQHGQLDILRFLVEHEHLERNKDGSKPNLLISAARGGHHEVAAYLLQHDEVCEQTHINASLPVVVETQNVELSRLLLSRCTDVNVADENKNMAISFAIEAGMLEIVASLIDRGADMINPVSRYSYTAVELMAEFGHVDMLRLVQQRLGTSADYQYCLFLAADNGHSNVMVFLFDEVFPADFDVDNDTGRGGNTALMLAAQCGSVESVAVLVQRGANVNKAANNGRTSLIYAAQEGQFEAVQRLCDHGAVVDHADDWNTTAIIAACEGGHLEIVEYLLEVHQTNVQVVTVNGLGCLALAIKRKRANIVRVLLAHGASARGVEGQRVSPVLEAVLVGDLDSLELLTERDANLNEMWKVVPDGDGEEVEIEISPLIIAAGSGNMQLVKYLCKHGAEVELKTSMGESPLSFAAARAHLPTSKYLIKKHADVESKNAFNLCAGDIANLHKCRDVFEYLLELTARCAAERDQSFPDGSEQTQHVNASQSRKRAYDRLLDGPDAFEFAGRV